MKKLLALVLAAALVFSLAACGDSGAEDTETPSTGNGDTTQSETPSDGREDAKEEMLANAPLLNILEMKQAFNENKIRAEETYLGNSFKIFGIVREIESEYCDIYFPTSWFTLRVYMDKEELKELNTGEGINIVGTLESFEKGKDSTWDEPPENDIININPAYYIDNIVYGVFGVETFLTDDNEKSCIAESVLMLGGPEGGYRIFLDQEAVSTLNEQDFILVGGTAYVEGYTSVGPYSYNYELRNAELVLKGQDEINAYFEEIENKSN